MKFDWSQRELFAASVSGQRRSKSEPALGLKWNFPARYVHSKLDCALLLVIVDSRGSKDEITNDARANKTHFSSPVIDDHMVLENILWKM